MLRPLWNVTVAFGLFLSIGASLACGEDWPRFRGPAGAGISTSSNLPVEFGPDKNVAWKVDSGRGTSSPIVIGGHLYFTSYEEDQRTLHCLDADTGETLWTSSHAKIHDEVRTPPCGPATPTPTADEQNVYAFYSDTGLFCYSHAGQQRWRVDFEPFYSFHGIASSLITTDGNVVLLVDQLRDSFMAVYNGQTGEEAWKVDRLNGVVGGFSTPLAFTTVEGVPAIVAAGPKELVAYDARTGDRLWWLHGATNAPISVPVLGAESLFLCEPYYEENPFKMEDMAPYDKNKDGRVSLDELKPDDHVRRIIQSIDEQAGNGDGSVDGDELQKAFGRYVGSGGLVAVNPHGSGDVSETNIRWRYQKTVPQIPSVLLVDDVLYMANDGGALVSVDALTGEMHKRERLQGSGRKYEGSPVAAGGHIYLLDSDGNVAVVAAGRQWKLIATNSLGEACHATPAIADNRLYVRTKTTMYCFSQDTERGG